MEHNIRNFVIEKGVVVLALDRWKPTTETADVTQEEMTNTQVVAKEGYLAYALLLGLDNN